MNLADMTWRCHVCGDVRPDAMISVCIRPAPVLGIFPAEQHIRYCNDRPHCIALAPRTTHFEPTGGEFRAR